MPAAGDIPSVTQKVCIPGDACPIKKGPESFAFATELLPRNSDGKILKRTLREQLIVPMEAASAAR